MWRKNAVTEDVCDGRVVEFDGEVKPLILCKLVSVQLRGNVVKSGVVEIARHEGRDVGVMK